MMDFSQEGKWAPHEAVDHSIWLPGTSFFGKDGPGAAAKNSKIPRPISLCQLAEPWY